MLLLWISNIFCVTIKLLLFFASRMGQGSESDPKSRHILMAVPEMADLVGKPIEGISLLLKMPHQ